MQSTCREQYLSTGWMSKRMGCGPHGKIKWFFAEHFLSLTSKLQQVYSHSKQQLVNLTRTWYREQSCLSFNLYGWMLVTCRTCRPYFPAGISLSPPIMLRKATGCPHSQVLRRAQMQSISVLGPALWSFWDFVCFLEKSEDRSFSGGLWGPDAMHCVLAVLFFIFY